MKKIGVVLAGCGFRDGSEIHEAVCTLLAISQAGCEAICMAPAIDAPVTNHLTMTETGTTRSVLEESARIARGAIRDVAEISAADLDALILPGGFGAAKNLCDFAFKGAGATVNPEVARLVTEVAAAGKPIGAICIAPVLIATVLGKDRAPTLTIGNDPGTAAELEKTGARHQDCLVTECVVDAKNKIASTPAYMLANSVSEVAEGIGKCVRAVVHMI